MWSTFEVHFGTRRRTLLGSILEGFGVPLGSLGASLWEKKGVRTGVRKMMQKTGLRGNPGNPERDPVRPYKQTFLEPCGTSLDHFDHFESMLLDTMYNKYYVLC